MDKHGLLKRLLTMVAGTLIVCSCSVGKYLPEGGKLLQHNQLNATMTDGSEVTPEVKRALSGASQFFYQQPNKRLLFMPMGLWLYCTTNPDDSSGWANFWRNQGEPPVVYNQMAAQQTAQQLQTLMKTKGCFNSTVTVDTIHEGEDGVTVRYNVKASLRRKIDEVGFFSRQPDLDSLLKQWSVESLLKEGSYYDQDLMTAEQTRIATNLKNEGYYHASREMIRFYVDTNYDPELLSVMVTARMERRWEGDSAVDVPLQKYHLDKVYLYPNVSSAEGQQARLDTLVYSYEGRLGMHDYYFVHNGIISPKPRTICQSLYLYGGQQFRPRAVSASTQSLLGLHNYKYVDISFEESPASSDSNRLLNARIRMLNNTRHRLSLSLELTNTSDFGKSGNLFTSGNLGVGTTLGYQNNNLFGGAEMLNVEGNLLIDLPKNVFGSKTSDFYQTFSAFEAGFGTTLDLPSFVLPFSNYLKMSFNRPHTLVGLNANYLFRKMIIPKVEGFSEQTDETLEQVRVGASFGYSWTHRRRHQHKLLPMNLSFAHLISGDLYYLYLFNQTNDLKFLFMIYDYVLLNTHYEYTFTDQTVGVRSDFDYVHISLETAGNVLNMISIITGYTDRVGDDRPLEFYQYVRFETEYKRYIYFGKKSTLVLRALAGLGLPYGHSVGLPYEKMFVGGGPTTMRGWSLRRLGTGLLRTSEVEYALGLGEVQVVANVETRFPLVGIFEGAVFCDAGNVWNYTDWGLSPRSTFNVKELLQGVAWDAGLGLRLVLPIMVLRLDVALPLYDPGYREGMRWLNKHWSWKKVVLNLGINYPF
ncbi:MAG: BamA/TamA family outer membrane protein [Bacteroidales bacterium]|nr:BamA/TamA family outer membrane protein [Bacteroidales bacterium]